VSSPGPAERPVPGVRATSGPSVCYAKHLARVPLLGGESFAFPAAKRGPQERRDFRKVLATRSLSFGPA